MMKNMLLVIVSFGAVFLNGYETAKKLPSYVKICKANDPNLSRCWKESFEALRPYASEDQPKINLPAFDPLRLEQIALVQDASSTNLFFNANLTHVEFSGGKDFEVLESYVQLEPYLVQLRLRFPQFVLESDYSAKGRVLVFEFDGQGRAQGNFSDVIFNATWTGTTFTKKGKEYLVIKTKDADVQVSKMYLHFDNLFRGNPEITENVNNAINENIDLLYNDFQPVLKKTLDTVITGFSNRFYDTFSKDELYPQD